MAVPVDPFSCLCSRVLALCMLASFHTDMVYLDARIDQSHPLILSHVCFFPHDHDSKMVYLLNRFIVSNSNSNSRFGRLAGKVCENMSSNYC